MRLNRFFLGLPALVPSWRFFDRVAPSPRIEFRLLEGIEDDSGGWEEFRPCAAYVSPQQMVQRMFWNARWNEALFLVSCAERLLERPDDSAYRQLQLRLRLRLEEDGRLHSARPYLQFRLLLVSREAGSLQRQVAFTSPPHPLAEGGAA